MFRGGKNLVSSCPGVAFATPCHPMATGLIHERALRIAYKDYENDFGFLLERSKSVPIHVRNLQLLMTEIYKTKCGRNPPLMKEIFMQRNISYSLRRGDATAIVYSYSLQSKVTLNCQKCEQRPLELSPLLTLEINCGRFYGKK